MEPELFAASISDINEFISRLSKQETQKNFWQKCQSRTSWKK
jgi:hypothetical protein